MRDRLFVILQYLLPRYALTALVYRLARVRQRAVKDFLTPEQAERLLQMVRDADAAFLGEIELDLIAFLQRAEALRLDFGKMDEGVTRTIVERNEAETLLVVEPLHGSLQTRHRSPSPA